MAKPHRRPTAVPPAQGDQAQHKQDRHFIGNDVIDIVPDHDEGAERQLGRREPTSALHSHLLTLNVESDYLWPELVAVDSDSSHCDWQSKAPRASAARIEIEHILYRFNLRLVGVSADDCGEACDLRIEV